MNENYLYVLLTNGEFFDCYFETHNKKFDREIDILCSNIESIHSFLYKSNYSEVDLLLVIDNCLCYLYEGNIIHTQYKTFYEYFAQELQITYKTIDLKLQNEIRKNALQIKGFSKDRSKVYH